MSLSFASTIDVLQLHPADNVCIATRALPAKAEISAGPYTVRTRSAVQQGHKIALVSIPREERITKYGQTIGFATGAIEPGDWVHTHNMSAGDFDRDYAFASETPPAPQPITDRTFQGYRRASGKVGTRNYLGIISSVNCSASVSKYIAQRFDASLLKQFPNVDGVLPLTHKGGCAMQYHGEDHQQLDRTLAGFAKHPNIGAYLLVGLGCETGTIGHLIEHQGLVQIGSAERKLPPVLHLQDLGGTSRTVEEGVRQIAALLPRVNDVRRETIPAAELILGTNCGGSDGNSGITANPALGIASDLLVAAGGTSILAETPEIYGAEHLLTRRASSREVGEKLVERIDWWKHYTKMFGVTMDNNPSPGNKAGGLTTIYEKSLGAIAKGGSTALTDVCLYAERPRKKGFVVMDTPGYDPVSVTGLVAGGANIIVFTTGRGSCFGCKPVPSIKIATNTPMYERMVDDMDIDAGVVLTGTPLEVVGRQIFEMMLEVVSGRKTKSELHGIGEEEFAPWAIGPTL